MTLPFQYQCFSPFNKYENRMTTFFLSFSFDIASDRFDPLQMSSKSYNFSIPIFIFSHFIFYLYLFKMSPLSSFHYTKFYTLNNFFFPVTIIIISSRN